MCFYVNPWHGWSDHRPWSRRLPFTEQMDRLHASICMVSFNNTHCNVCTGCKYLLRHLYVLYLFDVHNIRYFMYFSHFVSFFQTYTSFFRSCDAITILLLLLLLQFSALSSIGASVTIMPLSLIVPVILWHKKNEGDVSKKRLIMHSICMIISILFAIMGLTGSVYYLIQLA